MLTRVSQEKGQRESLRYCSEAVRTAELVLHIYSGLRRYALCDAVIRFDLESLCSTGVMLVHMRLHSQQQTT